MMCQCGFCIHAPGLLPLRQALAQFPDFSGRTRVEEGLQ